MKVKFILDLASLKETIQSLAGQNLLSLDSQITSFDLSIFQIGHRITFGTEVEFEVSPAQSDRFYIPVSGEIEAIAHAETTLYLKLVNVFPCVPDDPFRQITHLLLEDDELIS